MFLGAPSLVSYTNICRGQTRGQVLTSFANSPSRRRPSTSRPVSGGKRCVLRVLLCRRGVANQGEKRRLARVEV